MTSCLIYLYMKYNQSNIEYFLFQIFLDIWNVKCDDCEIYHPDYMIRTVKHGGANIIIRRLYGCPWGRRSVRLHINWLEIVLLPSLMRIFVDTSLGDAKCLQDNAP